VENEKRLQFMTVQKHHSTRTIKLPGLVDPHDLTTDRQFSMNLARGMEVLRSFSASDPYLGNKQISDRTGLPKPTVSRLTYSLTLLGYLNYNATQKKYQLGSGVLSLGYPLLVHLKIRQIARPIVERLARDTGCTVNVAMRDRTNAVYIDTARTDTANRYLPDVGSTRPLLSSSIGRALILGCSATERNAILNYLKVYDPDFFEKHNRQWKIDRQRFEKEGYCYSRGDWKPEVRAVATPLILSREQPVIAINCSISVKDLQASDHLVETASKLKEAARQIEQLHAKG